MSEEEFTAFKQSDGDAEFSRPSWSGVGLPDGWEAQTVGENVDVQGGGAFSGDRFSENYTTGTPLIKRATVNNNRSPEQYLKGEFDERYRVSDGDILVSMDGHFRSLLWEYGEAALNQRVCKVTPEGTFNSRYLSYALVDSLRQTEAATGATTVKSLSISDFDYIELPTPPVGEQERIASVLYTVDQHVNALSQRHDYLTDLKHALMQDLLTGQTRFDKDTPLRDEVIDEDGASFIDSRKWSEEKLKEVTKTLRYGDEKKQSDFDEDGEYPVYGANGVIGQSDEMNCRNQVTTVTCRGATCGTVHHIEEECWITNNSIIVDVEPNTVNQTYLSYYLSHMDLSAYTTGSAQSQITLNLIDKVEISLPPLWEQERIASVLYTVDEMIARTSELRDEYEQLKRGLMQDLLSGDVRTPETFEVLSEVVQSADG